MVNYDVCAPILKSLHNSNNSRGASGTKKEEYRGFTDHFINRLCEVDEDGQILDTKKYETVKFQMGYNKDAPQMVVE